MSQNAQGILAHCSREEPVKEHRSSKRLGVYEAGMRQRSPEFTTDFFITSTDIPSTMLPMEETTPTISLMGSPKFTSKAEKLALVISCIAILGGAALYFYGEQATGIGWPGLVNKLIGDFGMAVFSIGTCITGLCFVKWIVISFKALKPQDRAITLQRFAKQLLVVVVNILVYGGCIILCLGGLAALDGASFGTLGVVFVVWAACITIFVCYRRYRKKHKVSYDIVKYVAIAAFLLGFGAIMFWVFAQSEAPNALQDLAEGPQTADVLLVEADIDYASARYRAWLQDQHILTFATANDERIVLKVPEKDVAAAQVINKYGNFVHLTYYPRSQIFCEATPWHEGATVMGPDLLDKLVKEYAFEL